MPTWLGVVLEIAAIVCPVAVTYHNRFVPDVEKQKKHLAYIGMWLLDITTIGIQLWLVYKAAQISPPITAFTVVAIASIVGGLWLTVVLIIVRRTSGITTGLIIRAIGRESEAVLAQKRRTDHGFNLAVRNHFALDYLASRTLRTHREQEEFKQLINLGNDGIVGQTNTSLPKETN